ncbi:MAG: hypothetical protein ACLSB9_29595 [Hydrogeniiclostridium mannosilyticum]
MKSWVQKTGAETGLSKEFKDIFEVGGVPLSINFIISVFSSGNISIKDSTDLGIESLPLQ